MLETLLNVIIWLLMFLGIAIAVILGIVIVLLVLVLFVPLRYNGEFIKDSDTMRLQVKVSWLLRLVRVLVNCEKELSIKAHVLCFKVYDSVKKAKEKPEGTVKNNRTKPSEIKEIAKSDDKSDEIIEEDKTNDNLSDGEQEEPVKKEDSNIQDESDDNSVASDYKEDKSIFKRIKNIVRNIICKCKSIYDKIKSILQNINYYIEIIKEEETKVIFGGVLQRVFKVLKAIRPRKLKADIIVGTGAPDTTGYLMAIAGMLYPCLGRHVNITPDFDNTIFEGHITFKGRITVFVILLHALKVYNDKELRKLISRFKREEL